MPVVPGRYTAQFDGPFVVFAIGMRINRPLAFHKWVPVTQSMGPMLQTLYSHPEKGFMGGELFFYWPGLMLLQYWRSFDDLERFARAPVEPHLSAWKRFNQAVGVDGSVGIFHETYQVAAGGYEAVYNNMPVFGLAKATKQVPAIGKRETARRRLGGESQPAVESPTTR